VPHAELVGMEELPPEMQPQLAEPPRWDSEAFLAGLFLRRYVTFCARQRRYAQMNGAARLLTSLRAVFRPLLRYPVIEASW